MVKGRGLEVQKEQIDNIKGDTIKTKLIARVDVVTTQIIEDIKSTSTRVSMTLDSWTSSNKKPMLAINIHWLDNKLS